MKNIILVVCAVLLSGLFESCGVDATPIKITFVFDKPLAEGKYPDYFKEITTPFSAEECDADYLLKPIGVTRLDIKNAPVEINAWYFEQMGDNTVEFSKNWLAQFYKDSLVDTHLTLAPKRAVADSSIDKYLDKDNVLTLIYSEDADTEMYKDYEVFTTASAVSAKIKESVCKVAYQEIVVLVNPAKLATVAPLLPEPDTVVETTIAQNDPCTEPTTAKALDLKDAIVQIVDTNKSFTERLNLAETVWNTYCHQNAYVALYNNRNESAKDVWDPGSGKNYFTRRLAILESIVSTAIFRVELANDGKISGIHIIECQNADEIL